MPLDKAIMLSVERSGLSDTQGGQSEQKVDLLLLRKAHPLGLI